jgi:hypothetical protein
MRVQGAKVISKWSRSDLEVISKWSRSGTLDFLTKLISSRLDGVYGVPSLRRFCSKDYKTAARPCSLESIFWPHLQWCTLFGVCTSIMTSVVGIKSCSQKSASHLTRTYKRSSQESQLDKSTHKMGKFNGSSIGKVFGLRNLKQLGVRLPARQLPLRLAELCRIDWSLYNHIEHGQFSDNPMLLTLLKALKIILDSVLLSGSHTIPIRRILVDFEFLCS